MPLILLAVIFPSQNAVYANESEIKIAGGSTALGSMELLAAAFQESHPRISVRIYQGIGSAGGLRAVAGGAADIGLMGRPLLGNELTMGLSSIEYARTPLAFIAGGDVNVSGVTMEDVVKIYRGETTTWPNGERIRLILYSASDLDTALERQISREMSEAIDAALARPGMIFAWSTQDGYDKVKKTPGSFGFCSLTKVLTEKGSVRVLSYNGVLPSVKNLKNGSYPLYKPLYVVVKSNPSRAVRDFLHFIFSSKGQLILEKAGGVPVSGRSKLKFYKH
ncbi:MAG: substrate-binding domain-containing protein [Nitrospiraceae bacterium]|nr:substrate-binding domain-containing protein [Nitrospiraceae bacterium]